MTVHTRYDSILPRLPRDETPAEQRQFNESILKALEKLAITANADITKLNTEEEYDFVNTVPIGQRITAYTVAEADAYDDDDRLIPMWEDSTDETYTVSKRDYPDLALARPHWVSGENINIPNKNNRVERNIGDNCETEGIGGSQEDQLQGVRYITPLMGGSDIPNNWEWGITGDYDGATGNAYRTGDCAYTSNAVANATDGPPRTGTETRGKAIIVKDYVRAK